jgi:hypothetical protein
MDVSGQPIRPIFKDTDGSDTLSRNMMTSHPELRNKPEEQRSELHVELEVSLFGLLNLQQERRSSLKNRVDASIGKMHM